MPPGALAQAGQCQQQQKVDGPWAGAGWGPPECNRSPFHRGCCATRAPSTHQWVQEGMWRQVGEKQLKG